MKQSIITALIATALTTTSTVMAFGGHGGHGRHGDPMHHMQSELNLSTTQLEQMKAFRDEQHKQRQAMMKATHERIAQILTPEQATKFKEMTAKMEERMAKGKGHYGEGRGKHDGEGRGKHDGEGRGKHGGPMMGKGADRLKEALNLTPEQVTQVETIMKEQRPQMEQMRTVAKNQMMQLLTAEQLTKFQALEAQRKQQMQERIKMMQERVDRM